MGTRVAKPKAQLDESADRLQRLAALWAYLPAFRVVAETEHLPTASERLGISPSALSRTIRMIEQELGESLFHRSGRNLQLNENGRKMLLAVREAMRRVHQGLFASASDEFTGIFAIASRGLHVVHYLNPVFREITRNHPSFHASVLSISPSEAGPRILEGRLDLWLGFEAITHGEIRSKRLGIEAWSVFCGLNHPFANQRQVPLAKLSEHDFVALVAGTDGRAQDGWPDELERRVALYLDDPFVARDLCMQGRYLALLPETVVTSHANLLVRVPTDLRVLRPVIASYRPRMGEPTRTEVIVQKLTETIVACNAQWGH
jgi:DNA-binding transcriptional LysR family regulator